MGIVAVGAGHEALIHAVFKGHRKIAADVCVAPVAEFSLTFLKKAFGGGGLVDRMAAGTDHVVTCMR
jgi:hypothetical protein